MATSLQKMKKLLSLVAIIFATSLLQASTNSASPANDSVAQVSQPAPSSDAGFVQKVSGWYCDHLNYGTVTMLMALESSFIPFPSEIVVPPAAWSACEEGSPVHATDSSLVNIILLVIFATLGAIVGALINYYLSYFLGRPIVYWFADSKVGHLFLLSGEKVKKAEEYFVEHGNASTFIGRLVPGIRQLISIPAGLAKMPILPFIGFTALGATVWNIILAIVGYVLHGQADLIQQYIDEISWGLLGLGILFVGYLIYKGIKNKKKA